MAVSGTNFGPSGADYVGMRGVSGTIDIVKNAHALSMDGRLAGTLADRGRQ